MSLSILFCGEIVVTLSPVVERPHELVGAAGAPATFEHLDVLVGHLLGLVGSGRRKGSQSDGAVLKAGVPAEADKFAIDGHLERLAVDIGPVNDDRGEDVI